MTQRDFEKLLAVRSGYTLKAVRELLDELPSAIAYAVNNGGRVALNGLGVFRVTSRKPRRVCDINRPGVSVHIPATKTVAFRAAKSLKGFVR